MKRRFIRTVLWPMLVIAMLALTAIGADYKWPPRNDDPYPTAKGKDGDEIIYQRWDKASQKQLGTDADLASIKKIILASIKGPNPSVKEVRWLSSKLIMADAGWWGGREASAGYFYVVRKNKDKWEIVTYYMLVVS